MRRSTFTDQPVTYAAVGATLSHDLTLHPPKGYRAHSRSIRLGSGDDRFATSAKALMTWGVQRGSGVEVTHVDPGTGEEYAGVRYAEDGTPERLEPHHGTEAVFDEDGHPYIANGMTAVLRVPFGPFHVSAPVRVVYVIEEQHKVGFGYGTMHGHPLSGEESFVLEQRDDDSVWLTIRSFSRAAGGARAAIAPVVLASQAQLAKRYLRALHPVTGNPAIGQAAAGGEPAGGTGAAEAAVTDVRVHDAPQLTGGAETRSPLADRDTGGAEGAEHSSDR
jgi:uncharacterized protein (UPF0548 family)